MASGASTACSARAALTAAVLIGAGATLLACAVAPAWADLRAPIAGRVVDSATGAPIVGAVVIATWWTELPPNPAALALGLAGIGGHGGVDRRTVYVREALTDRDGRFTIPSWSAADQWHAGSLTSYSPLIRFYAPDHAPAMVGLNAWNQGIASPTSPGMRAPRQIALFATGRTPKQDLGRTGSGPAAPSRAQEAYHDLQNLEGGLEADAMAADAPNAPANSPLRERARRAQLHARQLVGEDLRRAYANKDKP